MNSMIRVLGVCFLAVSLLSAQARKEFEVASIRPSGDIRNNQVVVGVHVDGSQVRVSFFSLKDYIGVAYRLRGNQIAGPDWLASQRFDINAKLSEGTSETDVPEMLQALLADRFKMKTHRETREFSAYALKVANTGLKLIESGPPPESDNPGAIDAAGGGNAQQITMNFGGGASFSLGMTSIEIKKMTMTRVADILTRFLDRPVVDMTNLKAAYDMTLELAPEDRMAMMIRAAVAGGVVLPPQALAMMDRGSNASLFDSMKKAGLNLEAQKASLDVLVIDQMEKTLNENREKVGATAGDVETAIAEAKKALAESDVEKLNEAYNQLQTASHKMAEALYQQTSTGGPETPAEDQASAAGASTAGGAGEDDVIDAEYVDVDENK